MSQTLLKEMLEHAVHFGHKTTKWNPRMKKYILTERGGVHIIDLEQTASRLEAAMEYLKKKSSEGARMLFVGTKAQSFTIVETTAKNCGQYYIIKKWVPGFLTNFSTIKSRVKRLRDLKIEKDESNFDGYTKNEKSKLLKEIVKLEDAFGGVEEMKDLPHLLIISDAARDHIAVTEAHKMGIPVVAIVDTNANPDMITYPIPGNDDAVKSLKYFFTKFQEAIKDGKHGKALKEKDNETA